MALRKNHMWYYHIWLFPFRFCFEGIDGRSVPEAKPRHDKSNKTNVDHMRTFLFKLNESW